MIFGIGSIIINQFGLEFKFLMWLGDGYGVRIGIAAVGLLLFFVGNTDSKESEEE